MAKKCKCVVCNLDTIYNEDDPIDPMFRYGYVGGVGQLCLSCYQMRFQKAVTIPAITILQTPNDADLGALVREQLNNFYNGKEEQTNHL